MRSTFEPVHEFIGLNNLAEYDFDFKITNLNQLRIIEMNADGVVTQDIDGTNAVYLSSVEFNATAGGGTVILAANLPENWRLFIILNYDEPTQIHSFKNKGDFTLSRIEAALDHVEGGVQTASWLAQRAVGLHPSVAIADFNPALPLDIAEVDNVNRVLMTNDAHNGWELGPTATNIEESETFALAAAASAAAASAAAATSAAASAAAATSATTALSATGTIFVDRFTGDGVDVTFNTTPTPSSENATFIFIDGVYKQKDSYSVAGVTITFSVAPANGAIIEVITYETFDRTLVQVIADAALASQVAAAASEVAAQSSENDAEASEIAAAASAAAAAISAASATMTGPVSSTANALARWNGTTGQAIKNSTVTLGDTGAIANTPTADVVPLTLRSPVGGSSNLLELKDSGGTSAMFVTPVGNIGFSNGLIIANSNSSITNSGSGTISFSGSTSGIDLVSAAAVLGTAQVLVRSAVTNSPVFAVKAMASQTSSLTEWTDSSNAVLSGVDKDGVLFALERASAPASPVVNTHKLYVNTAGSWFTVNSSGVTKALGGGGGGVGAIRWYLPDSLGAAREVLDSGLEVFSFTQDTLTEQRLFGMFTVPASYIAGIQMFLKKGKAFANATSGNFLFKTDAYIFKQDVNGSTTPTGYVSTNAQQAVDASANEIRTISDIDLTSNTGTINAVAVAAGDTILIRLKRASGTETSQVNDDVKLLADSFELVTSI